MSMQSMVVVLPVCWKYFQLNGGPKKKMELSVSLGLVTTLKGPFKHLPGPFLNGLGGKVKRNESLVDAARRECKEECGRTPRRSSLFYAGYVYVKNENFGYVRLHVFRWNLPRFPVLKALGEHERFDWYCANGNGMSTKVMVEGKEVTATILPSDNYWLMSFLYTKSPIAQWIRVNNDFTMHGLVDTCHSRQIPYKEPRAP